MSTLLLPLAAGAFIVATGVRCRRATMAWRSNQALFQQMITADPESYRGYWLSGINAKNNGRFDDGLELLDRAYRFYPRDRQLLTDYTEALLEGGRTARAAAVAQQLMTWPELRGAPNVVALYLNALGRAYGPDSVLRAGGRLFAQAPIATTALYMGLAHELRGERAQAGERYRTALRLAPSDTIVQQRLAAFERSSGR